MRRLYRFSILFTLLIGGISAARSQRMVNMQTTMLAPVNNQTVTVGTPFNFRVEFKNMGPDTLKPSDTLYFYFTGSSSYYYSWTNKTKKPGDTILLNETLTINSSSSATIRFCTYGYLSGKGVMDTTESNDSSCIAKLNIKSTTGINTVISQGAESVTRQLTLFPNPTSGEVALDYASVSNSAVFVRVLDLTGREVLTCTFAATYVGKQGFSLDISGLQRGLYFIELRQDAIRGIGRVNKF